MMGYDAINGFENMGGWGMAFGGFMMIFWVVVLVALVIFITRWAAGNGPVVRSAGAAEILEQRYARGEIDIEEYKERRKNLNSVA